MRSFKFDITIVGGGCIGSGILSELTRRGFRNIGLVDNGRKTKSATASSGGMLRVFNENPRHVDLALANLSLIQFYQRSGRLTQKSKENGFLYFFNKHRYSEYRANLRKLGDARYPFEILSQRLGRQNFPQFHWRQDEWAIYEPQGSQLLPGLLVEDLISTSVRQGALVIDDFQVCRISRCGDRFRIFGKDGVVTTKTLILAGGARFLPLLRELGLDLPLEARTIISYIAKKTQGDSDSTLPNYLDRESSEFACFGNDEFVIISDPDCKRIAHKNWKEPLEPRTAQDCYARNGSGFLGEVSGQPNLILATGWGGTGFKFALEIGNQVASALERSHSERRSLYATC